MDVLIHNLGNGKFLGFFKEWTADDRRTVFFDSTIDALVFCRDCGLKDVELVIRFDDGNPDLHLPVTELLRPTAPEGSAAMAA
jgi:hypothetical protein